MKTKWTEEDLTEAVKNNKSYSGVIRELGYKVSGGVHSWIKGHIINLKLDTSHFTGKGHLAGKTHNWMKKIPLDKILTEHSTYNTQSLKKRLFKNGMLENKCYECGLLSSWNGKTLSLQLDHINGNHFDNRIENLRILCPNCHAQTETFGTKNLKSNISAQKKRVRQVDRDKKASSCVDCGAFVYRNSKRCRSCADLKKKSRMKFDISPEELSKLVWEVPRTILAQRFKVSDTTIAKRCKQFGISMPPRGYWSKQ